MNRLACTLLVLTALVGCANNGNVLPFRTDTSGALHGLWYGAAAGTGWIERPKASKPPYPPEASFTIYADAAFLKYIPDPAGIAEVAVIFTFSEGGTESEDSGLVKVIGPMRRIPDETLAPFAGIISYGPKVLHGDSLVMRVQVIEIDTEEAADGAAMLDFIGNLASAFTVADPVTSGQIQVAKEVAKTLVLLDQNDPMMDFTIEFVPRDRGVDVMRARSGARDAIGVPLRVGHFGLVQQEVQIPITKFFYLTTRVWNRGWQKRPETLGSVVATPFTLLADIVALPITASLRVFADVPDRDSLDPVSASGGGDGLIREGSSGDGSGQKLILNADDRQLYMAVSDKFESYRNKSWMTFTIEGGRDPSMWAVRRKLSAPEASVQDLLKTRTVAEILEGSKVDEAIRQLQEVKKTQAALRQQGQHQLVKPASSVAFSKGVKSIELSRPAGQAVTVGLQRTPPEGGASASAGTVDPPDTTSVSDRIVLKLPAGAEFAPGRYQASVNYSASGVPETSLIPFELVHKPTINVPPGIDLPLPANTTLSVTVTNPSARFLELIESVHVEFESAGSLQTKDYRGAEIEPSNGGATLTLKGVVSPEASTLKAVEVRMSYGLESLTPP